MDRPRTIAPALLLLAGAAWAVACGDGAIEPAPPAPPPRATTVEVTPATVELTALGETVQLTAHVRDQNGQAMAGAAVAWSSGDASVATVDASGLATAAGNGTVTITATSGSASGTATMTVNASAATDRGVLVALYEATDGPNWGNNTNWLTDAPLDDWHGVSADSSGKVVELKLGDNALSGPIPIELGSLGGLTRLYLGSNELTGPVPTELGGLANLERLYLDNNDLTGPIPSSFLQLDRLDRFRIAENESLCVPGILAFAAWMDGMEERDAALVSCNANDVFELTLLFEVAGGGDWKDSDGWLNGFAVDGWHGVSADSLGRVLALDLADNGLSGWLPSTLAALSKMTALRIDENPDLSGRLPNSLSDLTLRTLHYDGTAVCTPADVSFQAWLKRIASHEGTGVACPPLSDIDTVQAVYEAAKRCMMASAIERGIWGT